MMQREVFHCNPAYIVNLDRRRMQQQEIKTHAANFSSSQCAQEGWVFVTFIHKIHFNAIPERYSGVYAVEVMTSHKLSHAYFLSVAMVLVHALSACTRILHIHL